MQNLINSIRSMVTDTVLNKERDLVKARQLYMNNIYGQWREGETVTYSINKVSKRVVIPDPNNPFATMFKLSTTDEGIDVEIHVSQDGREGTFTVRAYLPSQDIAASYPDGCPFIICMHPVQPKDYALEHGYAMIFMDTSMVAEDNNLRKGCFYDIYPYTEEPGSQTGELMAWGWAAAKVLDAIYGGLGSEFNLNPALSAITGVSRWGKATAVCGAFEKRFRTVIPVCSGAGGLALWNINSEGQTFDMTHCGGPADYTYTKNEPLSCLQSDAEQGWFNDKFLEYKLYSDIPVEQYMLPALAADASRQYFIVAAWTGEDWVNAPAMWACYAEASGIYAGLGLSDHIHAVFHKEGHALLQEDLVHILPLL